MTFVLTGAQCDMLIVGQGVNLAERQQICLQSVTRPRQGRRQPSTAALSAIPATGLGAEMCGDIVR